jgi:hypothetical protein
VTGSNAVAQFDDQFNVKFWASGSGSWLAPADQQQVLTGGHFRGTKKFTAATLQSC